MSMATRDMECRPTYVVELTPPGRAAVAVVLVAGHDATQLVSDCFQSASGLELAAVPLQRIVLGRWGGRAGEELVVCRRSHEQIEVHCHGGLAAVNAVMDRLINLGCCRISWQEWLHQNYDHPIRAAAHDALADARTARTAAILLDQFHGALTAAIQSAIGAVSFADWARAATTLEAVLDFREVGMHLTMPWRVVLVGRTNVGKSSLINALAGYQRSIVSHQPGTTRDVVTLDVAIDGWPVQLADTAGLRNTEDELESAGLNLAKTSVAIADLVIAVSDARESLGAPGPLDQHVSGLISRLQCTQRVIYVRNKVDLLTPREREQFSDRIARPTQGNESPPLLTSAITGEGIADLGSAIGRVLVPQIPTLGSAVPFAPPQLAALDHACKAIEARDGGAATTALQSLLTRQSVSAAVEWPAPD